MAYPYIAWTREPCRLSNIRRMWEPDWLGIPAPHFFPFPNRYCPPIVLYIVVYYTYSVIIPKVLAYPEKIQSLEL